MSKYHSINIYAERDGGFTVKGHGVYPRHSVNFGMTRIVFLDSFETYEEAVAAYPDAVNGHKLLDPPTHYTSDIAPSWFDPADAGEEW